MAEAIKAYSISEAVKELGVTDTTITRWANSGKLTWVMWVKGGTKSVTAASVAKMKAKMKAKRAQALAAPSSEEGN
jgi:predicted site-specific integrase-resolvase